MAQKKSEAVLVLDEKVKPQAEESKASVLDVKMKPSAEESKDPVLEQNVETLEEESNASSSFVNTLWDQYEQSRERVEQLRENLEDTYLKALKEVLQFNKQYRNSISKIYEQTRKTNKEMVSQVMQQINSRSEDVKLGSGREELQNQVKEVSGQLEKLALTPFRSFFTIVDQLEDNFEKSAEASVSYARESRNAWLQVRKDYVKLAKNAHINLVERGKNSIRELVKTE